jgi:N-acetylglucosamine-6-sulfatase
MLLPRLPILNSPLAVSILAGTNDLSGLGRTRDIDAIAREMAELVTAIRWIAPVTPLLITSVFPRSAHFRERLMALNSRYKKIAADRRATFVDVWPHLADAAGVLRPDFTTDGLHLSPRGYAIWAAIVRPHLERLAI